MSARKNQANETAEIMVVSTGNQGVLVAGTVTATPAANNIDSGQLGAIDTKTNTYIANGATVASNPTIQLVQGTPYSKTLRKVNKNFTIGHRSIIKSGQISAGAVTTVTSQTPKLGSFMMMHQTGFPIPVADQDYKMIFTIESHQRDLTHTHQKRDQAVTVTAKATAATAAGSSLLLMKLLTKANSASIEAVGNKPFMGLAVDSTGGSGQVIGTITAGTLIPFLIVSGVTYEYAADLEFVNSLQNAVANGLSATATIVPIDITSGATVDTVLTVGLNEEEAVAFDNKYFYKTRVEMHTDIVETVRDVVSTPNEGLGRNKVWSERYMTNHALRTYDLSTINHPYKLSSRETIPNYVTADWYSSAIIEFYGTELTMTITQRTFQTVVALFEYSLTNPAANVNTPFVFAPVDVATIAALNANVGTWLASNQGVEYLGEATSATPFV